MSAPGRAPGRAIIDARSSLVFVISFGVVSFFADMAYEGMRGIAGPYLATLGASGAAVGLIAGLGEFLGYTLRLLSGGAADRTRLYWPITLAGYTVQMAAVPALALTGSWPAAAALIILERVGKAARNPPRDVMLSRAGEHIGQGWAFGLHEGLDQAGATVGPLATALVLALHQDYRAAFAWLLIPAAATVVLVFAIRLRHPEAGAIRRPVAADAGADGLGRVFWLYAAGAGLVAFGFSDFALISYHFARAATVPAYGVPILYALAMPAAALGSLLFGRWFDRRGLMVLIPGTLLVLWATPLAFLGGFGGAIAAALLWGIGLGLHETVMAAAVATMVPAERRARAYGVFAAVFGTAWLAGSTLQGVLYDVSVPLMVAVALAAQIAGLLPIRLAARAMG